jgi:hypothetical protein
LQAFAKSLTHSEGEGDTSKHDGSNDIVCGSEHSRQKKNEDESGDASSECKLLEDLSEHAVPLHEKSESTHAGRARALISTVNPMNFIHSRKKPEDTEVSFSMFLQALHMVCGERCLCMSRRRSAVSLGNIDMANVSTDLGTRRRYTDDFSEYLN